MSRCFLCSGKSVCIDPDGPCWPGGIYGIGEAPGKDERTRPFEGKTGMEVNRNYLILGGLSRPTVRLHNTISCMPDSTGGKLDSKDRKDLALMECCAEHRLLPDLIECRPRIIIPMGVFACKVIDPTIDLELDHGIPRDTPYGTAFPMYHPAGGLHTPKSMLYIRTDWTRLRKYLKGTLELPVDMYAGREDYRHVTDIEELDSILEYNEENPIGCDTENTRKGDPFCFTFSVTPGTGYLLRADDAKILVRLQYWLDRWRGRILWHNWQHDETITDKMGLRFRPDKITDTMVLVYHLGTMAQGLKSLAYRELGMRMTDFDDVVAPHSVKLVLKYYREMYDLDWPKPDKFMERLKDGSWKEKQPQKMGTKVKRLLTAYGKDSDKDLFDIWDNWEDSHNLIEEMMEKPWPGKCISHVPFEEVISYACRDSDSLLRLYPLLRYMASRVRKTVQEHWKDGYQLA